MLKPWPLAFFSLITGIILGYYHSWGLILIVLAILMFICLIFQQCKRQLVICALIILGSLLYTGVIIKEIPASLPVIQGANRSGIVQDFPLTEGEKTTFTIKTDQASDWEKRIRVICYFNPAVSRGDYIAVKGVMKPPRRPGNPGEFNFPLYLSHSGIYYNISVKHQSDLHLIKREQGLLKWIDKFRAQGEQITIKTLPDQEAAILLGMLLGSREGIDENQYDAFQKTGIIHLFSVSGLHVGFLLLLTAWITSLFNFNKRSRFWFAIIVLLIYGTMVAWPLCVIRSILMGSLGLLAYYTGRGNNLLNAVAIAGIITLLLNPASLFTISFQLTFLATWGVIYVFPLLRANLPVHGRVWELILLPLSAELSVLPLIAYYFNLFTPVSILTNILVSYLSGAAVILGFLAFFLAGFIPLFASLLLYLAGFFIELIIYIVDLIQDFPGSSIWVATPPVWSLALYFAGLFVALMALRNLSWRKYFMPSLGVLLLFIIIILLPASIFNRGYLELNFIDVGQGDATLIKTPQGKFILIDGGGSRLYDVGKTTLLPYLHRRGIRNLNLLVNSHPDDDHLLGMISLAGEIPVKYMAVPASLAGSPECRQLLGLALKHKTPVLNLTSGQQINLEKGLEIKVLHPGGGKLINENYNNESAVLRLRYGDFSVLLTGDIEAEAMQTMINEGIISNTTVVKIPHHGSKGSFLPEFYQRVQPRCAIISVGSNNLYGHPHPVILKMLNDQNIKFFRTDEDGAVIIRTDGSRIMIKPALP